MNSSTTTASSSFSSVSAVHPKLLIGIYYSVFLALGQIMMALGATLTELARRTESGFDEISYSFMARSLGFFVGSIVCGRIYDRVRNGHAVLAGALAFTAVLAAFVPVTPVLWVLIGLFLVQGLAGSLINVGGNTMLMWSHRERNIGALLTGLHFSWGLGSAISPLIVEQMERLTGNINWAYWVLSLTVLPACVGLLRTPSPPHPQAASNEALPPVNLRLAILVATFFFFYTGLEATLISWIHTYTMQTGLGDKSAAYKLNSAFLLVFTFGRLLAIPIAARFRPRTILLTDFCGCFLGVAAILAWPSSVTVLWVASCLLGLSMASVFPTMLAFAERRMHLSGKLTGYLFSASSGGSMLLPFLVGQYFVSVGPQILFYIMGVSLGVDLAILTVLLLLYPTATKPKQ
ncbi:MAG TPA: MFS transporter [Blastocatellia bacterium]|nr:MFS transporter [Blastocatellia bacterium]